LVGKNGWQITEASEAALGVLGYLEVGGQFVNMPKFWRLCYRHPKTLNYASKSTPNKMAF
jgi:hypothetical protein